MDAWFATRKSLRSSKRDRLSKLGGISDHNSGLCRGSHYTDRDPIPADRCDRRFVGTTVVEMPRLTLGGGQSVAGCPKLWKI